MIACWHDSNKGKSAMYNVIFDMDGVIFDSENTLLECWLYVAGKHNLDKDLVRKTYIKCIGTNINQTKEIYKNAFLEVLGDEKIWSIWNESTELHRKRYPDGVLPLKAGVREILEYLNARSIPVGIASSSQKKIVKHRISVAGLSNCFVGIIGGNAVKISKPSPEIYLLACCEFGFNPANTFAIEDSFNGIRAASAAGMRPIMVPDILQPNNEIKTLSEIVCKDLFEVIDYLKSIN